MNGIILASGSRTRLALLRNAGVDVVTDPASIDEEEVKTSCRAHGLPAEEAAETLAELKARRVCRRHPGMLVVGADQMLECDGRWFDKPAGRTAARDQLLALQGRAHQLVTSAVVLRDNDRLWHHTDRARLTMRTLDASAIDTYLAGAGEAALSSVGAYQLEGLGAQLFSRVDGDFFTILGLPLLPLLGFLRVHGVVAS